MFRTISDGRHISTYIPPHLQGMFYRNPAAIHASQDGKDPYGWSTEGLVLYLPLWALKGSAFKSVDAYGHLCTPTGTAISWTPSGWSFAGDDEYIALPDDVFNALTNGTIAFVIKASKTSDIFDVTKDGANNVAIGNSGQRIQLKSRLGNVEQFVGLTPAASLSNDVVHHVMWTKTGSTHVVYIDGSASALTWSDETDKSYYFSDVPATQVTSIGKALYAAYFADIVSEFWAYNRALSAEEAAGMYNRTVWRYQ